jgi:hypothetical protein
MSGKMNEVQRSGVICKTAESGKAEKIVISPVL